MNKERRKEIAGIIADIEALHGTIDDLRERVESVRDEEQEFFDNMPESLQQGERGQVAEAAVSALDDALSALESVDAHEMIGNLNTAQE